MKNRNNELNLKALGWNRVELKEKLRSGNPCVLSKGVKIKINTIESFTRDVENGRKL